MRCIGFMIGVLSRRIGLATRLLLCAVLIAGLGGLGLDAQLVRAATITVTTTADEHNRDGDCSLREAIISANEDQGADDCTAGNGADTINLPAGDYVLSLAGTGEDAALTGDLDISEDLTIVGDGRTTTTINADDIDRVLHVVESSTVSLSRLTVQDGFSGSELGTGIYVPVGSLSLSKVRVTGNSGNSGAILLSSGTLSISESRIDGNSGAGTGGILVFGGAATIIDSVISGNTANGTFGGGLTISNAASAIIINSTVSGNTTVYDGGGIRSSGTTSLYNVTVANNTADSENDGTGEGGGIFVDSGTFTIRNSIIADNDDLSSLGSQHRDCSGALTSQGFNLVEHTTGCTRTGAVLFDQTGVDPLLGPLQNNGGQTFTHQLLAGSPAIEVGNPTGCADHNNVDLTLDQRGFVRNGRCDKGAFEFGSSGTPTATATATRTPTATNTPTATRTPTATPIPPAATNTRTPTPSLSPTRIDLPASSPTSTPAGPSPSPTRTPRPDPDASPTSTATGAEPARMRVYLPHVQR